MNLYNLYAKHFYSLGLNITCISNELTISNFYSPNILKAAYHPWKHLLKERQSEEEIDSYNWESATGVGLVAGYDNLHVLDIDGCSNEFFIKDLLLLLGLPSDYEWVVKTGSQNGYHIHFYSDKLFNVSDTKMCTSYTANEKNLGLFEKMELLWSTNVIVPNSMHESGGKYLFLNTNIPNSKPKFIDINKFNYVIDLFLNRSKTVTKEVGAYYDSRKITERIEIEQPSNLEKCDLRDLDKKLIFIFDIETDGLIVKNNIPKIVQISWIIMDFDGVVHKKRTEIIESDFDYNKTAFEINKITADVIKILGKNPSDVLRNVAQDLNHCSIIISHNLDFDFKVLENHITKYGIASNINDIKRFCTMKWWFNYVRHDKKYPKLTELYKSIFESDIIQDHNAISDVLILTKIVKALLITRNLNLMEINTD